MADVNMKNDMENDTYKVGKTRRLHVVLSSPGPKDHMSFCLIPFLQSHIFPSSNNDGEDRGVDTGVEGMEDGRD